MHYCVKVGLYGGGGVGVGGFALAHLYSKREGRIYTICREGGGGGGVFGVEFEC